ncbi:hypothetical protein QBS70_03120 [Cronobacter sakazakii]|nr:hypothetical protein [Cronobacter sakazakii]
MFAIFQQHAKPGAKLLFNSGPENGEAVGEFLGEALYHASLSPEEYTQLLNAHGFDVLTFRPNDAASGGAHRLAGASALSLLTPRPVSTGHIIRHYSQPI